MSKIVFDDGTVIKISDETEQELRQAFRERKKFYIGEWVEDNEGNRYFLVCLSGQGAALICKNGHNTRGGFYENVKLKRDNKGLYITELPTVYPEDFGLDESYSGY